MTGAPMHPTAEGLVAKAVTRALREKQDEQGPRPTADGTRGRGSFSHQCSRKIALEVASVPRTVPDDDQWLVTWQIGQDAHDRIQAGLIRHFGARIEVPVSYKPDRDISGNVDAVYDAHPLTGEKRLNGTAVEIKSVKQYAFDYATGAKTKRDEYAGPKAEHITQAAIYGLAPQLDVAWLHLIYWAKDTGQMADWILGIDEPLVHLPGAPTARHLAETEMDRFEAIFKVVDDGLVPKASFPGQPPLVDPGDGDAHWQCRFCSHQPTCTQLGADRQPLRLAEEVAVAINDGEDPPAPARGGIDVKELV